MAQEPTFLICAGATKAGTSWLYRYLLAHPDCHLRAIKELHFFNSAEAGTMRNWRKREELRLLRARARQAEGDASPETARLIRDLTDWVAVLARGPRAVAAYLDYLTQGRGDRHLVADITPAYAMLPETRLRGMAAMAADVRFLYLLRDPVSRLWSQARMLGQRRAADPSDFPAQSVAAMTDMLDGIEGGKADREDYAGAIARLRAAVAPEKLLILLQDELMTIPGIARLCRFLGIVDHPADLAYREHEGLPLDLPATLRARAQAALRPQYEYVARLMPELPASWRRNMTEVHG
ncbi:MAG: sulfotransferase [Rhodobacteraceae bacterium]|nr:sulfotransferase [Paracoccaceae bacterium]MCZ8083182.1 sulfotransferase [Paracoccaceae bacterium]